MLTVQTNLHRLDGRYRLSSDQINRHHSWISKNGANAIWFSSRMKCWVIGRSHITTCERDFFFKSDKGCKYPSDSKSWSTIGPLDADGNKAWITTSNIKVLAKKKLTIGQNNFRFSRHFTYATRVLKR